MKCPWNCHVYEGQSGPKSKGRWPKDNYDIVSIVGDVCQMAERKGCNIDGCYAHPSQISITNQKAKGSMGSLHGVKRIDLNGLFYDYCKGCNGLLRLYDPFHDKETFYDGCKC